MQVVECAWMQTYKINHYDFNLITLMVLDDFQEGVPAAWAMSNREDKPVLLHILESLKERCELLHTDWFMSDMAPQFSMLGMTYSEHNPPSTCGAHGM